MIKFLLVFILFNPAAGRYVDRVGVYTTVAECEVARVAVREAIIPAPGIIFALACIPTKPTDGTDL